MAERRMFAKTIVTSDAFLDLPMSARCLYFTLGMFCDDDGFCNNPKSIMRQIGASADDMNVLIAKKFILTFESGVIVIKHWKIHNYIQSDRYHPTKYQEEKAMLSLDENKSYTLSHKADTPCIQDVSKVDTEVRDRLGKVKDKDRYGEFKNVLLKKEEFEKLKNKFPKDYMERIESLSEYMRSKGKTYKDHYATILSWARKENRDKPKTVEPKKYKVFEKEEYEKEDFKAEQMPQEIREKLGGMFSAS